MKETVKTSRTAGYLEKIFRALNVKYFNGELEEPIITIQSTPRAYGHVTVAKAWQRGDTTRHELNIGAGTLARPIENVVATTLHECVHLWNLQNGIQDCSRGGAYHNKKFKEAAEARDLKISYDPRVGWSITEPTDALCEFILEQDWQDISMNRIEDFYAPRGKGAGDATRKQISGRLKPRKGTRPVLRRCAIVWPSIRTTTGAATMAKFVEVTLVKEVTDGTTEDFEAATSQEGSYTVIGESKGVTRAEFYAASNTIYRPSLVVTIWADEYDGETRAIIDGEVYTVIRTYPVGDKIELTCQQKGADENAFTEFS